MKNAFDLINHRLTVLLGDDFVIFSGQGGDVILKKNQVALCIPGEDDIYLPMHSLQLALLFIKLPRGEYCNACA